MLVNLKKKKVPYQILYTKTYIIMEKILRNPLKSNGLLILILGDKFFFTIVGNNNVKTLETNWKI